MLFVAFVKVKEKIFGRPDLVRPRTEKRKKTSLLTYNTSINAQYQYVQRETVQL